MVSKKLLGFWAIMDILLLAAGGLAVAMSIVWRAPDLLRNMVFTPSYLTSPSHHFFILYRQLTAG